MILVEFVKRQSYVISWSSAQKTGNIHKDARLKNATRNTYTVYVSPNNVSVLLENRCTLHLQNPDYLYSVRTLISCMYWIFCTMHLFFFIYRRARFSDE